MAGILQRILQGFEKKNSRKEIRQVPERKIKHVENSDFLLKQIDEFRDKAQQLQGLLISKESKVKELQSLVDEREDKAEQLQQILKERQEKADGITETVGKQMDAILGRVTQKLDDVQTEIGKQLESGSKLSEEQIAKMNGTMTEVHNQLASIVEDLEALRGQVDDSRAEVSEKVHSENVKCYRNIQDLFKEGMDQLEKVEGVSQEVKSLKGFMKFSAWISVVNLIVLVGLVLYSVGVFNML